MCWSWLFMLQKKVFHDCLVFFAVSGFISDEAAFLLWLVFLFSLSTTYFYLKMHCRSKSIYVMIASSFSTRLHSENNTHWLARQETPQNYFSLLAQCLRGLLSQYQKEKHFFPCLSSTSDPFAKSQLCKYSDSRGVAPGKPAPPVTSAASPLMRVWYKREQATESFRSLCLSTEQDCSFIERHRSVQTRIKCSLWDFSRC